MKTKKDKNRLPPFVPLTYDLLASKAYLELTPSAAKALPYFLRKVQKNINHPEYYCIDFDFSFTEAVKYGFSKATHSRTIKELMRIGFIDPLYKGGLRGNKKCISRFTLSDRWKKFGTDKHEPVKWEEFIQDEPF